MTFIPRRILVAGYGKLWDSESLLRFPSEKRCAILSVHWMLHFVVSLRDGQNRIALEDHPGCFENASTGYIPDSFPETFFNCHDK